MDPYTGEMYDEMKLRELHRQVSTDHFDEIKDRLVQISGPKESLEELQKNVVAGVQARKIENAQNLRKARGAKKYE